MVKKDLHISLLIFYKGNITSLHMYNLKIKLHCL